MSLDKEKLENALNEMGYTVEFNSDTPGIVSDDGTIIKFEDLPLPWDKKSYG